MRFRTLLEEMQWHKKNFFEQKLIDLVEEGNPAAVIFVNRTQNANRGYTEKIQVEHSGTVNTGIDIDKLNLPLETRRQILQAVKELEDKESKPAFDIKTISHQID